MAKKQHSVPETRAPAKPNREQRRHPEQGAGRPEQRERPEDEALSRSHEAQDEILKQGPQDVTSVRAKNSGHGKKTADKWNQ